MADGPAPAPLTAPASASCSVEILPDVTGLDRSFHYVFPPGLLCGATAGTIVRVLLHNRRVRGWVVAAGTPAPAGVDARPILEVVSLGPPERVVTLCRWAAWRWAGRLRPLLLAASPERVVRALPPPPTARLADSSPIHGSATTDSLDRMVEEGLAAGDAILRLPPLSPRLPVVLAALSALGRREGRGGSLLVLVESREDVVRLSRALTRRDLAIATLPEEWAAVAAGAEPRSPGGAEPCRPLDVAIGTRNAAFSPGDHCAFIVLDAHSESYRSERSPNFDAREVVAERARQSGKPVLFVTPAPSVELSAGRRLLRLEPSRERRAWGNVGVLDQRNEDPREHGYPSRLAHLIEKALELEGQGSGGRPVVVVLNRTGRARLLACSSCRSLQRCERCGGALSQAERPAKGEVGELRCARCGASRIAVCPSCGSARLRIAKAGVSRARELLEALIGEAVGEVTGATADGAEANERVLIGTEAVLHRARGAALVVFLDFDQELFAPRFRAAEQALVLVVRALRLVGETRTNTPASGGFDRRGIPQVVLRTSDPEHEVVRAAQRGDPGMVMEEEAVRRRLLRLPPESAMAIVTAGGEDAAQRVARLPDSLSIAALAQPSGVQRWVVVAADSTTLADGLAAAVENEPGGWAAVGLKIEVDPVSL